MIDEKKLVGELDAWWETLDPRTNARDSIICDVIESVIEKIDDAEKCGRMDAATGSVRRRGECGMTKGKNAESCENCAYFSMYDNRHECTICSHYYTDNFKPKPKKTRQSEFLKAFPNAKLIGGKVLSVDPCLVDRTYNTELCVDGFCKACKEKYWSQEVE